jgi:hypothetical protein
LEKRERNDKLGHLGVNGREISKYILKISILALWVVTPCILAGI